MTLLEHLGELRRRLIVSILAVAVGAVLMYFLYDQVLSFFLHPYCHILKQQHRNQPCTLLVTDPLEQLTIRLKVATFGGVALALPVVLWEIWRFITPGLHPREKRYAIPFIVASLVFFGLGALTALYTFPLALRFFQAVGGKSVGTIYSPSPYLRLVMLLIVVYGLGFEFPVLLVSLELAGVLTSAKLARWRRGAIIGVTVVAAVFTPSSDPISMFAMAIPMYLFYEGAIVVGKMLKR